MSAESSPDPPSQTWKKDETPLGQSSEQTFREQSQYTSSQNRQSASAEEGSTPQEQSEKQSDLLSEEQPESQKECQQKQARGKPTQGTFLSSIIPRSIFTDGMNSFWHFVIGMFAVKFPLLVSLFIFYQILDRHDVNICVDILEFVLGFTITYFLLKI
jgi:hypothetical protein